MKHHEPHDWKSGAIPGQGWEGANRQGGEKPRRWCTNQVGYLVPKRERQRKRGMWTPSSRYSGGAIFENSEETSYGGPERSGEFTLSWSGKVGRSEWFGWSNLTGTVPSLVDTMTTTTRTTQVGLVEHHEAHEGKVPFLNDSRSPDGVTVKTRGIPRSWRSRQRPTSLKLHRFCSSSPRPTQVGRRERTPRKHLAEAGWPDQANLMRPCSLRKGHSERGIVKAGARFARSRIGRNDTHSESRQRSPEHSERRNRADLVQRG